MFGKRFFFNLGQGWKVQGRGKERRQRFLLRFQALYKGRRRSGWRCFFRAFTRATGDVEHNLLDENEVISGCKYTRSGVTSQKRKKSSQKNEESPSKMMVERAPPS
jgi:hypothetical protein